VEKFARIAVCRRFLFAAPKWTSCNRSLTCNISATRTSLITATRVSIIDKLASNAFGWRPSTYRGPLKLAASQSWCAFPFYRSGSWATVVDTNIHI